jgi:asparagine synthase (glutamine-hydrolysing)
MHVPLFERARGGALLTGVGGDELLASKAAGWVFAAHRRRGPVPRDALSLVYAAAPRRLRALVSARRQQLVAPWLTPHGIERLVRALGADEAGWPSRWDRSVLYWHRTRAFAAIDDVLRHLGEELGVQVDNPLLSPMVLSVLANDGGPTGYPTRDDAMRRLFGDVLPAATITRGSKASFGSALWGPRTREFARSWNGDGVDTADVDVEGLRREWLAPEASFMTALLLQRAWLAANRPS